MMAEPIKEYVFTDHARFELSRRGLSEERIRKVIETPEQRWEVRPGRHVLQCRVQMDEPPKAYVIRVFVDVDRNPNEVVTAYRTAKVDKYWRQEP